MRSLFPNYERTILLVTFGRTGSTLLQGILNSSKDVDIHGENASFCTAIYNIYNSFIAWKNHAGNETRFASHPWYGSHLLPDENEFIDQLRFFTLRTIYPHGSNKSILGFKEIRYLPLHFNYSIESCFNILNFYNKLFLNVKYVFLTRNYKDVAKSGWWKKYEPQKLFHEFTQFDYYADKFIESNEKYCFKLKYEEMIVPNLNNLFEFLNLPYSESTIKKVLTVKHSIPY